MGIREQSRARKPLTPSLRLCWRPHLPTGGGTEGADLNPSLTRLPSICPKPPSAPSSQLPSKPARKGSPAEEPCWARPKAHKQGGSTPIASPSRHKEALEGGSCSSHSPEAHSHHPPPRSQRLERRQDTGGVYSYKYRNTPSLGGVGGTLWEAWREPEGEGQGPRHIAAPRQWRRRGRGTSPGGAPQGSSTTPVSTTAPQRKGGNPPESGKDILHFLTPLPTTPVGSLQLAQGRGELGMP